MTKKKRELIEILLDNVNPEDWPESLPYAAQYKDCCALWFYGSYPKLADGFNDRFNMDGCCKRFIYHPRELCSRWNKTIVHRDEFMKRWNERNTPVEVKTLTFSREVIDPVILTEKMEKISIKPDADSEGWIEWNGGEMPVEKGTLIDVKYRNGVVNLHVKALGGWPGEGSIPEMTANRWSNIGAERDIIAYRLHVPQEQKTTQQLALEKFGTDWHDNEGVQPVNDKVLIDLIMCNGDEKKKHLANHWSWHNEQALKIKKWRIHSDEKESQIDKAAKSLREGVEKLNGVLLTAQQAFDGFKKAAEEMSGADIESIISDRGSNYGRFEDGAEIMQQLKLIAHTSQGWERMKPVQHEAMDMILHKIGRILNGDPAYVDSWVDIEGYSNLVSSWLKGESK